MSETSEVIKNRMIKRAAALWGVPANEIEISFDPVVTLLLGACASEIEKIHEKINESQARVTEKIIQLMTPETVFGPKPAHCIVKTEPEEDEVVITQDFLFSFKKKDVERAKERFKDVFFNPIQNFKAVKGEVKYLAYGNTIAELNENTKEQNILVKTPKSFAEKSTIYIGVNTPLNAISLKNTSLYFEIQDFNKTTLFYHHLKNAKWFANGVEVATHAGLSEENERKEIIASILEDNSLKLSKLTEQVRNNYNRHFISIKDNFNTPKVLPNAIENVVQENRIAIDENTTWIKLVFPTIIDASVFETFYCCLNAFPVINRKKEEFTYQLKEYINIVPIKTSSLFLDIKSITNTNGDTYKLLNKHLSSNSKGVYTLKSDDISKLDSRKSKEYINHLIELLKSESAAFSYLNNSFLNTNLKKLNQIISLLEVKTNNKFTDDEEKETNYVAVTPYYPEDSLFVEFWVTDGEFANNIKFGSTLKNYQTVGLKQKKTSLLTSSYSGRNALDMKDRLNAYRKTLLTRDRVVTKQDVKLVCMEFFGEKITDVHVKNSYTVDVSLNKGMVNCIDIELVSNKSIDIDPYEWDFMKNNLLLYLKNNATSVFPFVIKKL